jgi:hypothetical protein
MHFQRQSYVQRDAQGNAVGDVIEILNEATSKEIKASGKDIGWNDLSARDAVQLQLMYVSLSPLCSKRANE